MATAEGSILGVRVAPGTVKLARPSQTIVYHLRGTVLECPIVDVATTASGWLADKFPEPIPSEIVSFERGTPGQNVRCSYLPELGLWAARLTHPDDVVAGRTWVTDVGLASTDESVELAIRVICTSAAPGSPLTRSRPSLIKKIATKFNLTQVKRVEARHWLLENESDLVVLEQLLVSPKRQLPVILVSELPEPGLNKYVLDVARLAQQVAGIAHVICLPHELTYSWTNRVGMEWSAYQGAIRTYRPGLDFGVDSPHHHPFALPARVLDWQTGLSGGLSQGPEAFCRFLYQQGLDLVANSRIELAPCLFYNELQVMEAAERSKAASGSNEEHDALVGQVSAQAAEIQYMKELVDLTDAELLARENERALLEAENYRLRARLLTLQANLTSLGQNVSLPDPPTNYRDLIDWVDVNLAGQLVLIPRAKRGLRNAVYDSPQLVGQSLILLATHYRDMKLGIPGASERFQARQRELSLVYSPSISECRAGEEGEEYYVRYPSDQSQRRLLGEHLKKGTSREERYSLRIYFYFDDEKNEVVIGSLPGHLDTRDT